ncbi:MAG: hypothetical protein QNJ68_22020 [Microcoleaceae cyanobacterium MO_207.B10]|nr:hypothetical protein [Microcoleaceae cyanobacterium MO_207.B10]
MSKTNNKPEIYVFGSKPKEALLVPEIPIAVRNNCQSGQWAIGDTDYGSKCTMTILKFSKFFGNLGQTTNRLWGQLWFVSESGELPQGVVMVTYIKSRSLSDFNRLVASVQARGIEPATGIFIPEYIKHSGQKPDENGVVKPINYYSLKWRWQERTDWSIIDQAAAMLSDEANLSRMIDLESTKKMVCLDNLSPNETADLMAAHTNGNNGSEVLSLNANNNMALPPGNEPLTAALS